MSLTHQAPHTNGHRRPRLLVIPHIYAEDICVREIELAKRLTEAFDVYCLCWSDASHVDGKPLLARRWKQLRLGLAAAFARRRTRPGPGNLTLVQAPVMRTVLLQRWLGRRYAAALTRLFNRGSLKHVVQTYAITHILLSGTSFELPRIPGVKGFLDIVDWISEDLMSVREARTVRALFEQSAAAADGVFAVSEPLSEKLSGEWGIDVLPLPNGADLKTLRNVSQERVKTLRRNLGLEGKYVLGYVGNHGSYTGVDFVVRVFERVRGHIPNVALLIVGPAEYWRALLEAKRMEGVVWTGAIPPSDVAAYFNALDLGILAQEKTLFTDLAFQIKIVEYTACRKFVISTPLRTWERLAWPNIFLTEPDVDAWVSAILRARGSRWQPEWDALVEPYEWSVIARDLAAEMLGNGAERGLQCAS